MDIRSDRQKGLSYMDLGILRGSPGVQGREQEDSTLNRQFEDFAGFYGFKPILCRPYRARRGSRGPRQYAGGVLRGEALGIGPQGGIEYNI